MPIKKTVIGIILRNPKSPTEKFYTYLLTSDGHVITAYGRGNVARVASRATTVSKINQGVMTPIFMTAAIQGMIKVIKAKRKGGYTQVDLPLSIGTSTWDDPKLIFEDFLNSSSVKYNEKAKRWVKEDVAIQKFLIGVNQGLHNFAMSPSQVADLRMNSTMRNADLAAKIAAGNLAPGNNAPLNNPFGGVKSSIDAIEKSLAGFRISGALIRPNGEAYTPRSIGAHHDVALIRHLYKSNIAVRLPGPPGAGKTALIEAAFPQAITVTGHGDMTIDDFVGTDRPDSKNPGAWVWIDGPLTTAMKTGNILYIDEITRVPQEVLAILYSVMDGRNILRLDRRPDLPPVHAVAGFGVIAAYNPEVLGARQLDEALISRFKVAIEVRTDFDTAKVLKVPTKFITVARNMETRSAKDKESGGPGFWVPQMRELLAARDLIKAGVGEDIAAGALLGSCPDVDTLPVLAQVASSVFGNNVNLLALGKSV